VVCFVQDERKIVRGILVPDKQRTIDLCLFLVFVVGRVTVDLVDVGKTPLSCYQLIFTMYVSRGARAFCWGMGKRWLDEMTEHKPQPRSEKRCRKVSHVA
jgi:hypothetical protein